MDKGAWESMGLRELDTTEQLSTHTQYDLKSQKVTDLKKLQTWQYIYYLLHLVFIFQIFIMVGLGKEKMNAPQFFSKIIVW